MLFHAFFFPLLGLIQGKMPHFLQRRYPESLYLSRGLVSPAKKWQFMSIHEASEPKSEQWARERGKGSWGRMSISQEGRMEGVSQLSLKKGKL